MNCKEKLKWNNSVDLVLSEMEKLSKNNLSKLKKDFRDESNENNYKKILNNLELLGKTALTQKRNLMSELLFQKIEF